MIRPSNLVRLFISHCSAFIKKVITVVIVNQLIFGPIEYYFAGETILLNGFKVQGAFASSTEEETDVPPYWQKVEDGCSKYKGDNDKYNQCAASACASMEPEESGSSGYDGFSADAYACKVRSCNLHKDAESQKQCRTDLAANFIQDKKLQDQMAKIQGAGLTLAIISLLTSLIDMLFMAQPACPSLGQFSQMTAGLIEMVTFITIFFLSLHRAKMLNETYKQGRDSLTDELNKTEMEASEESDQYEEEDLRGGGSAQLEAFEYAYDYHSYEQRLNKIRWGASIAALGALFVSLIFSIIELALTVGRGTPCPITKQTLLNEMGVGPGGSLKDVKHALQDDLASQKQVASGGGAIRAESDGSGVEIVRNDDPTSAPKDQAGPTGQSMYESTTDKSLASKNTSLSTSSVESGPPGSPANIKYDEKVQVTATYTSSSGKSLSEGVSETKQGVQKDLVEKINFQNNPNKKSNIVAPPQEVDAPAPLKPSGGDVDAGGTSSRPIDAPDDTPVRRPSGGQSVDDYEYTPPRYSNDTAQSTNYKNALEANNNVTSGKTRKSYLEYENSKLETNIESGNQKIQDTSLEIDNIQSQKKAFESEMNEQKVDATAKRTQELQVELDDLKSKGSDLDTAQKQRVTNLEAEVAKEKAKTIQEQKQKQAQIDEMDAKLKRLEEDKVRMEQRQAREKKRLAANKKEQEANEKRIIQQEQEKIHHERLMAMEMEQKIKAKEAQIAKNNEEIEVLKEKAKLPERAQSDESNIRTKPEKGGSGAETTTEPSFFKDRLASTEETVAPQKRIEELEMENVKLQSEVQAKSQDINLVKDSINKTKLDLKDKGVKKVSDIPGDTTDLMEMVFRKPLKSKNAVGPEVDLKKIKAALDSGEGLPQGYNKEGDKSFSYTENGVRKTIQIEDAENGVYKVLEVNGEKVNQTLNAKGEILTPDLKKKMGPNPEMDDVEDLSGLVRKLNENPDGDIENNFSRVGDNGAQDVKSWRAKEVEKALGNTENPPKGLEVMDGAEGIVRDKKTGKNYNKDGEIVEYDSETKTWKTTGQKDNAVDDIRAVLKDNKSEGMASRFEPVEGHSGVVRDTSVDPTRFYDSDGVEIVNVGKDGKGDWRYVQRDSEGNISNFSDMPSEAVANYKNTSKANKQLTELESADLEIQEKQKTIDNQRAAKDVTDDELETIKSSDVGQDDKVAKTKENLVKDLEEQSTLTKAEKKKSQEILDDINSEQPDRVQRGLENREKQLKARSDEQQAELTRLNSDLDNMQVKRQQLADMGQSPKKIVQTLESGPLKGNQMVSEQYSDGRISHTLIDADGNTLKLESGKKEFLSDKMIEEQIVYRNGKPTGEKVYVVYDNNGVVKNTDVYNNKKKLLSSLPYHLNLFLNLLYREGEHKRILEPIYEDQEKEDVNDSLDQGSGEDENSSSFIKLDKFLDEDLENLNFATFNIDQMQLENALTIEKGQDLDVKSILTQLFGIDNATANSLGLVMAIGMGGMGGALASSGYWAKGGTLNKVVEGTGLALSFVGALLILFSIIKTSSAYARSKKGNQYKWAPAMFKQISMGATASTAGRMIIAGIDVVLTSILIGFEFQLNTIMEDNIMRLGMYACSFAEVSIKGDNILAKFDQAFWNKLDCRNERWSKNYFKPYEYDGVQDCLNELSPTVGHPARLSELGRLCLTLNGQASQDILSDYYRGLSPDDVDLMKNRMKQTKDRINEERAKYQDYIKPDAEGDGGTQDGGGAFIFKEKLNLWTVFKMKLEYYGNKLIDLPGFLLMPSESFAQQGKLSLEDQMNQHKICVVNRPGSKREFQIGCACRQNGTCARPPVPKNTPSSVSKIPVVRRAMKQVFQISNGTYDFKKMDPWKNLKDIGELYGVYDDMRKQYNKKHGKNRPKIETISKVFNTNQEFLQLLANSDAAQSLKKAKRMLTPGKVFLESYKHSGNAAARAKVMNSLRSDTTNMFGGKGNLDPRFDEDLNKAMADGDLMEVKKEEKKVKAIDTPIDISGFKVEAIHGPAINIFKQISHRYFKIFFKVK